MCANVLYSNGYTRGICVTGWWGAEMLVVVVEGEEQREILVVGGGARRQGHDSEAPHSE